MCVCIFFSLWRWYNQVISLLDLYQLCFLMTTLEKNPRALTNYLSPCLFRSILVCVYILFLEHILLSFFQNTIILLFLSLFTPPLTFFLSCFFSQCPNHLIGNDKMLLPSLVLTYLSCSLQVFPILSHVILEAIIFLDKM